MLLRRCTRLHLLLPVTALIVAGCASSGPKPDSGDRAQPQADAAVQQPVMPEIPPQALTMYEQAAAAMAAGDYVCLLYTSDAADE